jgi:hypothetical protein
MSKFLWPHPTNAEFNEKIRSIVKLYGSAPPRDKELLQKAKDFLSGCVKNLLTHKVKRDTEKYFQLMNLEMEHCYEKNISERNQAIYKSSVLFFTGDWREHPDCMEDYKYAALLEKPKLEIIHKSNLPLKNIIRFLEPIRPIEDTSWDARKTSDILVYENSDGEYEVIDGNHRVEFAQRLKSVETLSGWIIKDI